MSSAPPMRGLEADSRDWDGLPFPGCDVLHWREVMPWSATTRPSQREASDGAMPAGMEAA